MSICLIQEIELQCMTITSSRSSLRSTSGTPSFHAHWPAAVYATTMYDHNVFAVFTAFDQRNMASSAFRLSHNSQWFRKAEGGVAEEPTIDSRETTPPLGPLATMRRLKR